MLCTMATEALACSFLSPASEFSLQSCMHAIEIMDLSNIDLTNGLPEKSHINRKLQGFLG
ncbi:hypothetical protein DPMN_179850 [Dreissena polymorpha]|uniref:Uncharacterized protein n=1 Tax=Dreissena polymorpha TaxID=45954 RepID=A0A9D4EFJ2_DREPO|nr:hypothetical protein DPMN_179850 [Dreissena polymorpha]